MAIETLRLLVSELATNCVRHADADAAARIDVIVSVAARAVRVEVSTAAPAFECRAAPITRPDPIGAGGLGLYLVEVLSQRWGVEAGERNMVWFELPTARSRTHVPGAAVPQAAAARATGVAGG